MSKVKSSPATPEQLTAFVPFSECSADDLIVLADHAWIDQIKRGQVLARVGEEDDWDYYLIEGTLKLVAADGRESFIMGGSRTARAPVAHLKPRRYTLSAMTAVTCLRVEASLLKNLSFSSMESDGMVVEEMSESDEFLENPLFAEVHDDLVNDRLTVPSMPEVAVKIRRMIEQEDASIPKLVQAIQADPAVSARLIKAANGALYHGYPPVETCVRAIERLGVNTTKHLVVSFVLRNLFQEAITTKLLDHCACDLWLHSVEVAAISQALANVTPGLDAEEALLAGLLHDIGELVILSYADNYPEIARDETSLRGVIQPIKGKIGRAVLQAWQFAEPFLLAAAEAEQWTRNPAPQADYCDVVLVAHLHSYFGTPKINDLPGLAEIPAFAKLAGGSLTPEVSMLVLDEAKEQIQETRQLFMS
ncbi:MAG TPA: HDOD domain-containing protein [Gammaproteobacteria bacterium]|nr:HDOD domain-containing protein [Gammaproteobacteria bacterium]